MDKPTPATDERVKQVSLVEGYLHIDLRDGTRLSGPVKRPVAGQATKGRLVETRPGSAWSSELNLDDLLPGPGA